MKAYRPAQRPGFSLIELLVVIGIMMFLAAVLAFTIPNILTSAKDAATRATLKKVGELLNKRMHAISREIQDQDKLSVGAPSYLTNSPFASVTPRDKAKVLARKDFFRRHLPMSFAEAERSPTVGPTHTAATENAEILYYFLTNGPQFDAAPIDTDFFRSSELADTDGDGAMELIDAYGHPLRFYRWPTRLIRPASSGNESAVQSVDGTPAYTIPIDPDFSAAVPGASARILIAAIDPNISAADLAAEQSVSLAKDPDDPLGLTLTRNPSPTAAEVEDFENALHTPDTWHAPLVVSAGRDGVLGLFEPNDLTRHGHLAQPDLSAEGLEGLIDNLTNQQ